VSGFCEYGDELSGFIQARNFLTSFVNRNAVSQSKTGQTAGITLSVAVPCPHVTVAS